MLNKIILQQKRNYSLKLLAVHSKYRVREAVDLLKAGSARIQNIKLPERFRGTLVEKWVDYWKNLTLDYYEVYKDSVKTCLEKPRRTVIFASIAGFASYLVATNPDEMSFRDAVTRRSNELLLIGTPVQNPAAVGHINTLEKHYSEGTVKRFSLGLLSIIWREDYNDNLAVYKATCDYLKPRYVTMYERILDVGFLDNWWLLSRNMTDYDVNPNEWSSEPK